jgi:DNA polymerase bacteriophage-type
MRQLHIDLETYSDLDLTKVGVYKYCESPSFEILLFGYHWENELGEVEGPYLVVDLASGQRIPEEVIEAVFSESVVKRAYNAEFEMECLSVFFGRVLPAEQWDCVQVQALELGFPGHLDGDCKFANLPDEYRKSAAGKALIRYFCMPCKPTKKNGLRTRNLPEHEPEKWASFIEYCRQDVVAETALGKKISRWPIHPAEREMWIEHIEINRRGWQVDVDFVNSALAIDAEIVDGLTAEFFRLTGITRATMVAQLKKWLFNEHDIEAQSLSKASIKEILLNLSGREYDTSVVEQALRLRTFLSKSSVAKYKALAASTSYNGRCRGLFSFYRANRTGRWAATRVQPHNMPRSGMSPEELMLARAIIRIKSAVWAQAMYPNVSALLSELTRTAFISAPGCYLIVIDFSAIEARVLAWAAGEEWRLEVFRTHGKIYEASAARMFNVPIEQVTEGSELRFKGKISELALGYHGAENALVEMGALDMGLTFEELPDIVSAWRAANRSIMTFGKRMEKDAKACVRTKLPVTREGRYTFRMDRGILFMELPSGRSLSYPKPALERDGDFINVTFSGVIIKQVGRIKTYAGKLLENYCQAVARDCLRDSLIHLKKAGFPAVGHVHDEPIVEVRVADRPCKEDALADASKILSITPAWAPGLPLAAKGFTGVIYRKG